MRGTRPLLVKSLRAKLEQRACSLGGYGHEAWRHASDLTEDQWRLIEPLTERPDLREAKNKHARRRILDAVRFYTNQAPNVRV